jgi:hypothetical protein
VLGVMMSRGKAIQGGVRVIPVLREAQCASCHLPPYYTDNLMHNLRAERLYKPQLINGMMASADGPSEPFLFAASRIRRRISSAALGRQLGFQPTGKYEAYKLKPPARSGENSSQAPSTFGSPMSCYRGLAGRC